jgi:ribonuclease PH
MARIDGRRADELRPVSITPNYVKYPEGSVLIAMGETRVLCNVSVQEGVPSWKQEQGYTGGWVTAEYGMLPRSTHTRTARETHGLGGRTQEIRRLIGRSLRAAVDLEKLGQRTFVVDCDVIQADGGTRTAAISGGYLALKIALQDLIDAGEVDPDVFLSPVAAVSVGIIAGEPMLDLCYREDATAEADLNVVMNASGDFIEVQGTAERASFSRDLLDKMLDLAAKGIQELLAIQISNTG